MSRPPEFVLDVSVAAAWVFQEERTESRLAHLRRALDGAAIVPSHFAAELSNIVVVAERVGRLTPMETPHLLLELSRVPLHVDYAAAWFDATAGVARAVGLTTYDAAYLELAKRLDLPLATADEPMRLAALRSKIKLLDR